MPLPCNQASDFRCIRVLITLPLPGFLYFRIVLNIVFPNQKYQIATLVKFLETLFQRWILLRRLGVPVYKKFRTACAA